MNSNEAEIIANEFFGIKNLYLDTKINFLRWLFPELEPFVKIRKITFLGVGVISRGVYPLNHHTLYWNQKLLWWLLKGPQKDVFHQYWSLFLP